MRARRARWRAYWTQRGVIPRWQQFGAYALISIAAIVGFKSIGDTSDHANRAAVEARHAAHDAQVAARGAQTAINAVQEQRQDVCKDQNDRHDKTLRLLHVILAHYVRDHPEQAKQVQDSVRSNVLLINALAPKRDCAAIAPPNP